MLMATSKCSRQGSIKWDEVEVGALKVVVLLVFFLLFLLCFLPLNFQNLGFPDQTILNIRAQGLFFCSGSFWFWLCTRGSFLFSVLTQSYPSPFREASITKTVWALVRFTLSKKWCTLTTLSMQMGHFWGS